MIFQTIERSTDVAHFTALCNAPDVRPWLGEDDHGSYADPFDASEIVMNANNVCVKTAHGGFIFVQQEPGIYQVHSLFTEAGRGRESIAAQREAAILMFTETDCVELLTHVPVHNRAAWALAKMARFEHRFNRPQFFKDVNGEFQDIGFYGLTIERWALHAPLCAAYGRLFHRDLEIAKEAADMAEPLHADDSAHDHMVGAAVLMANAGLVDKAITVYNRWARFARYHPLERVNDEPIVVFTGDAFLTMKAEGGFDIEVYACQPSH